MRSAQRDLHGARSGNIDSECGFQKMLFIPVFPFKSVVRISHIQPLAVVGGSYRF